MEAAISVERFVNNSEIFSFQLSINSHHIFLFVWDVGVNNFIEPNKASIDI